MHWLLGGLVLWQHVPEGALAQLSQGAVQASQQEESAEQCHARSDHLPGM